MENKLKILNERELLGKNFKVYSNGDEFLFLAKDIAEWIDYAFKDKEKGIRNVNMMLNSLDEDEKIKVATILPSGRSQDLWYVTEDGLYEILMLSRKPIAKEFKKKVKIILKEIRKNGGYIHTDIDDDENTIMAKALLIANKTIEKHKEKIKSLQSENEKKQEIIIEQKSKVDYYNKVTSSKKAISMSEVAKLLKFKSKTNKRLVGRNILFGILRGNSLLNKYNQPYQKYVNLGYFEVKQSYNNYTGEPIYTTLVTSKGIEYKIKFLRKLGFGEYEMQ